jgi:hypothetical protein
LRLHLGRTKLVSTAPEATEQGEQGTCIAWEILWLRVILLHRGI